MEHNQTERRLSLLICIALTGIISLSLYTIATSSPSLSPEQSPHSASYDRLVRRVSVSTDGIPSERFSTHPEISGNGEWVVFASISPFLAGGDTNEEFDIFLHHLPNQTTERVSISSSGVEANGQSILATLSQDGQLIAFESEATNLVAGDTNQQIDIFVHNRQTGETERVSVSSAGVESNGESRNPAISRDGRYILFRSEATNLVANTYQTLYENLFLHDRQTGETVQVPRPEHDGVLNTFRIIIPTISADGSRIAYMISPEDDFSFGYYGYIYEPATQQLRNIFPLEGSSPSTEHRINRMMLSANGRYVAFQSSIDSLVENDDNMRDDIFVIDLSNDSLSRVSLSSDNRQSSEDSTLNYISADGRYILFSNREQGFDATIRYENGLDIDWSHIYLRDTVAESTEMVSRTIDRVTPNLDSFDSSISDDGMVVAFESLATNLITPDTNDDMDIFIYERGFILEPSGYLPFIR